MEEHAQKIAAARDAIGDADFFLVARTDARATSKMYGLQDAIARANLYMEVSRSGMVSTLVRNGSTTIQNASNCSLGSEKEYHVLPSD